VKHITPVLLLATGLISPCIAAPVTPNFTSGTITSETRTRTEVVEVIKQVEYSTGNSYTVTGTNINIPDRPGPGANYSIINQGAPFQFSETQLTPGIAKETWIDRKTTEESITNTISVFTQ
jgi:hypothetical protein